MDETRARELASYLKEAQVDGLEELDPQTAGGLYVTAKDKPILGLFRYRTEDQPLHIAIVSWRHKQEQPSGWYLVLFRRLTARPVVEAHDLRDGVLRWRYAPKLRDGRNPERIERFKATYGDVEVEIPVPARAADLPAFVQRLANLAAARDDADALGEPAETEPPASTRSWIFQANPKYYDIAGALTELGEMTFQINQHADKIQPDDTVFVWQSGPDGGLLARGTVLTEPQNLSPSETEQRFVRDASQMPAESSLRARLRIDETFDEPVDRETLREDPRLVGLSFLRAPQGTNFPLTAEQAEALVDLARTGQPRKVVKIEPGDHAKHWPDCLEGGYACVKWDKVGDLSRFADREALLHALQQSYPMPEAAAKTRAQELWLLRELEPGDLVVANRGPSEVLAVGTVREPGYVWRPDRAENKHTVTVEWDTSFAKKIPRQTSWEAAVVRVPTEVYRAIALDRETPREPEPPDGTPFMKLRAAVQDAGLSYSDEVLSAYLLALQTKRFVILSGISGTGKTQLALSVARVLGRGTKRRQTPEVPDEAFEFEVKPYTLKYNRVILPQALVSAMRLPEGLGVGSSGEIEVEWPEGRARLRVGPASQSATTLLFKAAFKRWFQANFSVGDPFYIELVETDDDSPHRLRFGRPETKVTEVEEPRYTVIPVRPDWTDDRGLLGYYNPILQQYMTTDFLRLVLRARAEAEAAEREQRAPDPYFVILDEMNLARVEHYFSGFLSALESGEEIPLHNDPDVESGEKGDVPQSLAIPPNLYFTGTVNVDETTYMFSPKVLDRAFVMELNLVDLEGFSKTGVAGEQDTRGELRLWGFPERLHTGEMPSSKHWEQLGTHREAKLRRAVVHLHRVLEQYNRHFGYRVANEIGRFVTLAFEQAHTDSNAADPLWIALDLAVLFKVLPKLHGTQQELEDLLASLFAFAVTADYEAAAELAASPYEGWRLDRDTLRRVDPDDEARVYLPRTAAKLWRMGERLRRQGFTSFIE